ncbi:hypothetical protein KFE25_013548 [Diacronema lutheri]|uniref:CHCH domain-containing protein n=1 Tax=Diacronema lutheri TaxID=2081491 RepID=A0A7R9YGB4_DIALT|nr:hypothetical protein KFE25_013548 [Diacronema lutheri]|mmetsp:Transcript_10130/g.31981  ORF Transcript_10130/g.31981 Transcript_10130/m.31981 type:complete len:128 (+) Transcript_10130:89-472(+)
MSLESPSGRQWPRNKPKDAAEAAPTDVGRPVFCARIELDALRCLQTHGKGAAECQSYFTAYRNCIEHQKSNIQLAVIDCSTFHTASLRCLEDHAYDKNSCSDAFLEYKMCNAQRQASIKWQRKIGNI